MVLLAVDTVISVTMASGAIESIEYATDETYVRLFN
jgi:hypothetical protein